MCNSLLSVDVWDFWWNVRSQRRIRMWLSILWTASKFHLEPTKCEQTSLYLCERKSLRFYHVMNLLRSLVPCSIMWSKEKIMQKRSAFLVEIKYQQSKRYLESSNFVEIAKLEWASLNMLFFSTSFTLFRLSFISLRSVWICLLIACHIAFDARSSNVRIFEASSLTRLTLCVWTIDSKAMTKTSWRYAKLKLSMMLTIAENIWVSSLRDDFFDSFDL